MSGSGSATTAMRDLLTSLIFSPAAGVLDNMQARIFGEVLRGHATTRKELTELLGLRSTTVSELVGELLAARLLTEMLAPASGRGRPTQILIANPHRLAVIVFQVVGRSIRAVSVNLLGQVLRQHQVEVPADCENAGMLSVLIDTHERIQRRTPETTQLAGVCFALSGLVDPAAEEWIFTSRWPSVRNLSLRDFVRGSDTPVSVTRNLDAELRARLLLEREADGGVLLLHWGDGIGTAFGLDGEIALGHTRGFGEIGHWRIPGHDGLCRCGRRGCLETVAALWAIGDDLMGPGRYSGLDEEQVAQELRYKDLSANPKLAVALEAMVLALANLCRVLFPKRVVVTGPLVGNAGLWELFRSKVRQEGVMVGYIDPEISLGTASGQMEIDGASAPLLRRGLIGLLRN